MNTLSWLIYAAEVLGNLKCLLAGLTIIGIVFVGVCGIAFAASEGDCDTRPLMKRWIWAPILTAFIACVLPSSTAIYMIAASQAGEQVITSPGGAQILGDVKGIIEKRLKEALGDGSK